MTRRSPWIVAFFVFFSAALCAQTRVESRLAKYFSVESDDEAGELLSEILNRLGENKSELIPLIKACKSELKEEQVLKIPYRGQLLQVTVRIPKGHDRTKARLPVVLDASFGNNLSWLKIDGAITAFIDKYTPPEFSDEGRDGFLKVLKYVAHFAHGDMDRMWMTGFSWAAHASYDTALHRPGQLRGIIPLGGGPRRVHFRLLPNLQSTNVFSCCGGKDDNELIWNLVEIARLHKKLKLNYKLNIDKSKGHSLPLAGMDAAKDLVKTTVAFPKKEKGKIYVDAVKVSTPMLRVDKVEAKKVRISRRIPVSATASPDQQRRKVLQVMGKKVATLDWKINSKKKSVELSLKGKGVRGCTVYLRDDRFQAGEKVHVKSNAGTKKLVVTFDPRTALTEARRTGDRMHVVFQAVKLDW
ncbi:MAG: hypothetical protein ACI97A_000687 [Planctomycetota bacterium]|jgi:hypothetical protein